MPVIIQGYGSLLVITQGYRGDVAEHAFGGVFGWSLADEVAGESLSDEVTARSLEDEASAVSIEGNQWTA